MAQPDQLRAAAGEHEIGGRVAPGFEPVRSAFVDNFAERSELSGVGGVGKTAGRR